MKIKRSVLKKILKNVFSNLNVLDRKVRKMKDKVKKGVKSLFNNSVIKECETQLEKIGKKSTVTILSKENLEFYIDDCSGNLIKVSFEEALKTFSKEVKEAKQEIKETPIIKKKEGIVDEYAGKKYIINEMIKSVYFKAKELVVTINGILLRVNEEYRKTIDKFLEIRTMIRDKAYYMVKENNFLLKFIIDNDIDSDKDFDSCLDILTKMYIIEKEQLLYKNLNKFAQLQY